MGLAVWALVTRVKLRGLTHLRFASTGFLLDLLGCAQAKTSPFHLI